MFNILTIIQKRLVIVIPVVMLLGFFFGLQMDVSFLKQGITPLTFLMVYPMMVTLPLKKVLEGGDTKVQVVTQIINFLIVPFIAYGIGIIFYKENTYLALGLLLTGLLPTSGMTISWTGMAKGNMAAAVKMTVLGLLLGSVIAPLYIKVLMGATVTIDILYIFKQIAFIIVLPLVLGNITQIILVKSYGMAHYQEKLKKKFPPFSTLGVVGIVFVAMSLKAKSIMSNPSALLMIFIPLLLLYIVNFIISLTIGKVMFKRDNAIALLYGTVLRNLSIALAIAMSAFGKEGSDIALVVALGYIIQIQLSSWSVKYTDKIFGSKESESENVMHYGIFSLHNNQTLAEAKHMFRDEVIHSIIIVNEKEIPVGVMTQKHLIHLEATDTSDDTLISNFELDPVVTAGLHKPVKELIKLMDETKEYKIVITDKDGSIKGVVTASDIL